ncbi:MAG: twin-arginine translocase TatA/TatE family subunit [Verrucomicrobium sp.]|nr:twin-arginine translocase TatA/TatE family subunit [Verrucomicrobium sp.]
MHADGLFLALLPHGLDWVWIVLIVLLLFGPKKLPELARGLGKSLGEFKKAKADFDQELKQSMQTPPPAGTAGTTVATSVVVDPAEKPVTLSPPPAPLPEGKRDPQA